MQRITTKHIQKLAQHKDKSAVSIYMPVNGTDYADNREYLKYLLGRARDELTKLADYREKHEALYPAYRLLHDREWWRFVDEGVAIFSTKGSVKAFHLSSSPTEEIIVSNRFHILPLVREMNYKASFYVLALSAKNARLLHCDGDDILEYSVQNMPRSIDDYAAFKSRSENGQMSSKPPLKRAINSLRSGGRRAIKRQNNYVLEKEYLQKIHGAISGVIENSHEPLVLAGLPKVQSMYRKIDHSSYISKEGIPKNPDRMNNFELRDRAKLALTDYFAEKELQAQSQFLRLSVARPEKIVYGIKNVMQSVYEGKVQTLLVDKSSKAWGKIQRASVEVHNRRNVGDSNLLDVAASETVKRRGKVFTLESSDLPPNARVAAILRY